MSRNEGNPEPYSIIIGEKKWDLGIPFCEDGRVTIFWRRQTLPLRAAGMVFDFDGRQLCMNGSLAAAAPIDFYETHPDCQGWIADVFGIDIKDKAAEIVNQQVGAKIQDFVRSRCWRVIH